MARAKPFRRPDLLQVLPQREWIANNMPSGQRGFVVEDLDIVIRVFPPISTVERFCLLEVKWPGFGINYAQLKTFGLIDRILRAGDPGGVHYAGFHVVEMGFDAENNLLAPVTLNRRDDRNFPGYVLTVDEFKMWLGLGTTCESYFEITTLTSTGHTGKPTYSDPTLGAGPGAQQ